VFNKKRDIECYLESPAWGGTSFEKAVIAVTEKKFFSFADMGLIEKS